MTANAPEPARGSSLTVQGWQNLVLSVMGVLVLAGAIAGALLLNHTDQVSRELIDEIQPARVAAYRLQAVLRDQETAIRGYLLTGDGQFLVPYNDGVRVQTEAAQQIRDRVGDRPELIADLDAIEAAAGVWRSTFAQPLITTVEQRGPNSLDLAAVDRGKAQFDGLRALFDAQNERFTAVRTEAMKDLDEARGWRNRILVAMVAVFVATALLLGVFIRRALTRPLGALAAACRRITKGNFGEEIVPQGPRDIRAISTDVDNMRRRIVDELDATRTARAQLAEQTEALDAQAIELRRSNAELEQFAYVASHDLQEPLRKVASFCQLLEKRYRDKLDDRGVEYIRFAVDGAKRMQVLINDLLGYSRVGRMHSLSPDVDLDATLDTAMNNLVIAITESGAEIVRPPSGLPRVTGDPTLLSMLWQNLIGNAVKFRHAERAPRIVIECDSDGDNWLFCVTDNGIGIAEEFADKVFVIFQRLHNRETYGGTGIGLALCKKIVEHHGGTIWIDTAYTDGTRFRFTVPDTERGSSERHFDTERGSSERHFDTERGSSERHFDTERGSSERHFDTAAKPLADAPKGLRQ